MPRRGWPHNPLTSLHAERSRLERELYTCALGWACFKEQEDAGANVDAAREQRLICERGMLDAAKAIHENSAALGRLTTAQHEYNAAQGVAASDCDCRACVVGRISDAELAKETPL